MNLLVIDNPLPSSVFSGKTVRVKNIYGRLAEMHKITYARVISDENTSESEELLAWARKTFEQVIEIVPESKPLFFHRVKSILGLKPWYDLREKYPERIHEIQVKLTYIAEEMEADAVITFAQETAAYGEILSNDYPWIQDLGDSMDLQLKRRILKEKNWIQKSKLIIRRVREKTFEEKMVKKAITSIFVADDDCVQYSKRKCAVIPNGVDTEYFNIGNALRDKTPYVVFTGHMNFPPNIDSARYFAEEIMPLCRKQYPDLQFKIVGADPTEEVKSLGSLPGVTVTGRVEDIRPYVQNASAFVCPMRMGSGIKNKLLEAMSMGKPVVATELAAAGIDKRPSLGFYVTNDPQVFAQKVIAFIESDEETLSQIRNQSRAFVVQHYDWSNVLDVYNELFEKMTAGASAPV